MTYTDLLPALSPWRFEKVFGGYYDALIGLKPFSDVPVFQTDEGVLDPALLEKHTFTLYNTWEYLDLYDWREWNVGVPTGAVNNTTLLLASTTEADEWLRSLELPETRQSWSRMGRHYHYDYVLPSAMDGLEISIPGLQILNDGDHFTCPGSVYEDGRVAHWEADPWGETVPFPLQELWDHTA